MATILFQAAGASLGGVFGPVGAILGRAAGALAGNVVDRALIGGRTIQGARLATARIPGAGEGTAINRVYGTIRVGGTLIWATRFEEEVQVERAGAKATGGNRVESFRYFGNFAFGLCEGPIAGIRRVWADGREIDLTTLEMRVHTGTEDQLPDPLIEAKQGMGDAPAYRGLAYVVFERMPLGDYGNRIPMLQFEVMRPVGGLESAIRAVTVIPGATEHGYATEQVSEQAGAGSAHLLNRNMLTAGTDWQAAIDELQALCPNLAHVALVVTWFGDDLRAGHCRIRPGVEVAAREGESVPWRVAGMVRDEARPVSWIDGGPAFGGTPNDASVVQAIADLKARGLKVTLYPFLMMDIAPGNGLPDPYGGSQQARFPWRGRVTGAVAAGLSGTTDGTAAALAEVSAFLGDALPADFTVEDGVVSYHGTDEGYRRLVLHYALLAQAAGGVDAFLIGSELKGLTTLRDGADGFPFVRGLVELAADVRAILGPDTRITYGADWSEYFGHQPADGSGDVYFHLDPLWASDAIDAVGIDNYMPLSDWRDADRRAGNPEGFRLPDDGEAFQAAITSGEGFDWYYAGDADRVTRTRTPISDGAHGKPWVFRYKDLAGWWSNPHYERRGGVELATATAWTPGLKPIWFTELGCPAVDRGANQPNVFPDPKSSEDGLPHFSSGMSAASQQRRFLEAHFDHWSAMAGMVDLDRIYLWSWDARPYPAFPSNRRLWRDGDNWATGHWLNGRLGAGTLAGVIAAILTDHGFEDFDVSQVSGDLEGYVQGELTSARAMIEPLMNVFGIDAIEDGGRIVFRSRRQASLPAKPVTVVADGENEALWRETRGHEGDLADEAAIGFFDVAASYGEASARSRRLDSGSTRLLRQDLSAALFESTALDATEAMLRDHRLARRRLEFALAPTELSVEPGDVLTLADGPAGRFLVTRIEDSDRRRLFLHEIGEAPQVPRPSSGEAISEPHQPAAGFAPVVLMMDLPRLDTGPVESFARIAAFARPWSRLAVSSSMTTENYRHRVMLDRPATLGTLLGTLTTGPSGRLDRSDGVHVKLYFGEFASISEIEQLAGGNRIAVRAGNGAWEVLSFREAVEIAAGEWKLTGLLRGLCGTEDAMHAGAAAGADVVKLNAAVVPLGLTVEEAGLAQNLLIEAISFAFPPFGPVPFSGGMRALTPLAPVHLDARRLGGGDIDIRWKRRGRLDADDWGAVEIPLDEEREAYLLEILSAGTALRAVETEASGYRYPLAEQLADFVEAPDAIAFRVRQRGRKVAFGLTAEASIEL